MSFPDRDTVGLPRSYRKSRLGSIPQAAPRISYWWPLILVVIGIGLLMLRILEFSQEPPWLSTLGDIFGVLTTLAGLILLGISNQQNTNNRASAIEQLYEPVFPFHVINSITELISALLPEPAGDILLSDRDIPYIPRDLPDLGNAFAQIGRVLLRGRSKTGKTRAIIELLRLYWKTTPTVLVLKRDAKLEVPDFVLDNVPRNNLVIIIDDIHNHAIECKKRKVSIGAVILGISDFFIQYCGNQPGEVRFILIARKEPECWDQMEYIETNSPWDSFKLIDLPSLSFEEAQQLILELASVSPPLKITSELVDNIARSNDGTYYRIILAFRDWRKLGKKEITSLHVSVLQTDLLGSWRYRRANLFRYKPSFLYVYAALDLARVMGVPAHKDLIIFLTQLLGNHRLMQIIGWIINLNLQLKKWIRTQLDRTWLANIFNQFNKVYRALAFKLYFTIIYPLRILLPINRTKSTRLSLVLKWFFYGTYEFSLSIIWIAPLLILGYILITYGFLFVILEKTGLLQLLNWITPTIGIVSVLLLEAIVLIIFMSDDIVHLCMKIHRGFLGRVVKQVSATEIPIEENILVPYDLQVDDTLDDFVMRPWVAGLKSGKRSLRKDSNTYSLLEDWFRNAHFDEIGWDIGVSLGELLVELKPKDPELKMILLSVS